MEIVGLFWLKKILIYILYIMSDIIFPPKEIPQPTLTATSFSVYVNNLVLNTSCTLMTILYDEHNNIIKNESYLLQGQEYQDWTTDDYIITFVRNLYDLPPLNNN